jgi:N-acetylglucosaminyl-diphospho-decaprenol L-rhamnosyltransferase
MTNEINFDVSVIIINYRSDSYLKSCIDSVRESTKGINFEIIVVDNGSDDDIANILKYYDNTKLITNNQNVGFSTAANQGIEQSTGTYILLLNPDTQIFNGAITEMKIFLDDNDSAAIVGPLVYDKDGETVQLSCRSFPSFTTVLFNRYSLITKLFPKNRWSKNYLLSDWNHENIREVDWVSGCCMMIRRAVLNNIGLFDTRFFMYNEDVDICKRVKSSSNKVYYFPKAKVKHDIGGSSSAIPKKMTIERHKSMWRFYKKYYDKNFLVDILTFIVVFLRCSVMISFSKGKFNAR